MVFPFILGMAAGSGSGGDKHSCDCCDYDCCAICNGSIGDFHYGFFSEAQSKIKIGNQCLSSLSKNGIVVNTVPELIEWMKTEKPTKVISILGSIGFKKCEHSNQVDKLYIQLKEQIIKQAIANDKV